MRERGGTKRRLEKELKVLGVAERAVKRITCTLQCGSSAWLSGFLFFLFLVERSGCVLPGKACSTTSTWATTFSFFRRPHLISFQIIENKGRPKKYCKLVRMIIGVKSQEPVRHVTCKLMGGGSWQPVCLKRSVSACLTPSLRAASLVKMQSAWLKSLQSWEDVSLTHAVLAHFQA